MANVNTKLFTIERKKRSWTTKSGEKKTVEYIYKTYKEGPNAGKRIRISEYPNVYQTVEDVTFTTSDGTKVTGRTIFDAKGRITKFGQQYREHLKEALSEDAFNYKMAVWTKVMAGRSFRERPTTIASVRSSELDSHIKRWLFNSGYTPEEMADTLGVSVTDVLNHVNWDFTENVFYVPNSEVKVEFEYTYTGGFTIKKKSLRVEKKKSKKKTKKTTTKKSKKKK